MIVGPDSPAESGWSARITYATIVLVTLAIGTGVLVLP